MKEKEQFIFVWFGFIKDQEKYGVLQFSDTKIVCVINPLMCTQSPEMNVNS